MRTPTRCLVTLLAAAGAAGSAQADISLGFDTSAEGVVATDGGALQHMGGGGNPGGFLQVTDVTSEDMVLRLPASLLGDWRAYLGGSFAFDGLNVNGELSDWPQFGTLTLTSGATSLSFDGVALGQPPVGGGWVRYSIALTPANFGDGLNSVLANVTGVSLGVENHAGVTEVVGIDTLAVTAAVPEPASALLALGGLALLGGALRRRGGG